MVLFTINVVFEKIVIHLNQSTNITYLKCLRLKFMILIVDLEIEIARWIYDYLNISSCKHFQSVLFFFLNIFCIKLAYLLTTSLTLRLRLKIVFSENTSFDCKFYLAVLEIEITKRIYDCLV